MGFGQLLGMKYAKIRRPLVAWLVERFATNDNTLEIHGAKYKLTSQIFGEVVGLADGGEDLCVSNRGGKGFATTIRSTEDEGHFMRSVVKFVVGTLLMPTTNLMLSRGMVEAIDGMQDTVSVRNKNWASMLFTYQVEEAIRKYQGS